MPTKTPIGHSPLDPNDRQPESSNEAPEFPSGKSSGSASAPGGRPITASEMDGREATMAIRALEIAGSHVPIIALTAHAMDGDEHGILASGMDRYMTKPLKKAAILAAMAEFCPQDAVPVTVD